MSILTQSNGLGDRGYSQTDPVVLEIAREHVIGSPAFQVSLCDKFRQKEAAQVIPAVVSAHFSTPISPPRLFQ